MCCFFGFIKWSLSCIQRSLTFVLGFWVMVTILYALGLGLSAGVAFGYDYGLAEYKTLARPDVQFTLRPRIYVPEVLARRTGNVAGIMAIGDEYQKKTGSNIAFQQETYEYTPPTLWLYGPSQKTTQRGPPSTPATEIVKMYYRVTKARKMVPPEKEDMYSMIEVSETFTPIEVDPIMLSKTSDIMENLSVRPLIPISKARKRAPTRTSTKSISTSPKPDSAFAKLDSTTLKPYSTSAKTEVPTRTTVKESTKKRWHSSVLRIFKPKSTDFKWRPTKPNKKFFYKTLAASHRRKTAEDSYHPEMEIRTHRTLVHGKYERLPMRHWDAATRATEPTETSEDENVYKNIMYF